MSTTDLGILKIIALLGAVFEHYSPEGDGQTDGASRTKEDPQSDLVNDELLLAPCSVQITII
ncbi:GL15362 [Drosophila persimilis]|uniref:GL15362 n=1 Tax=Drosophila persimilis TaxID=7234 RepID=B4IRP6_DROPE|nr:GL15362 [Drosophila persimilis]